MPPQLALLICAVFVIGALRLDSRRTSNVSNAIWIPLIWVAVLASRPLLSWFQPSSGFTDVADGSALDRNILSLLMLAAIGVLVKRKLQWKCWVKQNAWIVALFLVCGISILWSDFPLIALKRWIRALGSILIILVVVSEKDPVAAIATVIRRCAFILVPMSIVLIKYYPTLGVGYLSWTGAPYLMGVTTDKNALGRLCLVSAVFALWELLTAKQDGHIQTDTKNRLLCIIVFVMTLWLLRASDSATSLAAFLAAACVLILLGRPSVRRLSKHFATLLLLVGPVVVGLALLLDLPEVFVASLGRNMTLTERTFIWDDLLNWDINPIIGVGYDSFWLGDRLKFFAEKHQVAEAHNGYLEMYIQLGFVGLFLFAGLLISLLRKATATLQTDPTFGKLRMTFLLIFILYNVTEAGSNVTTFIFFVLLLVGIEVPAALQTARQSRVPFASGLLSKSKPIV
jgi:exopolysaccharide production protein ExoQ